MKVVNRKDFLAMPEGILFCQGVPWAFDSIQVKGKTWGNDFLERQLNWVDADNSCEATTRLADMLDNGASYPMESAYGRDGMFEDKAIFLIFERDDLLELRNIIDAAMKITPFTYTSSPMKHTDPIAPVDLSMSAGHK